MSNSISCKKVRRALVNKTAEFLLWEGKRGLPWELLWEVNLLRDCSSSLSIYHSRIGNF